ncbi:Na+/H+ antiporter NhaA [Pusillimonas sp. SM2304]|uniref:Na+/H+ antiporter NhaA n=1 Tax=Pusillimonas sp. SM2304 TaxID=3073241 RepID=UPI002875454F|nr:Na+/H+ antiporter NhaA [Pusillimonas sp. SM2304]MDS1140259.1 Na+/H+ antiporter NhaA [Pusillimonas sp. SM2304]
MSQQALAAKLEQPVDDERDHVLGPQDAQITVLEYGSYACPYCRAVNDHIVKLRHEFGDRLRYVFRHYPLPGSDIALRAAQLVEHAEDDERFWNAHVTLMTRSHALTDDDLAQVALDLGVPGHDPQRAAAAAARAQTHLDEDVRSARANRVAITPTFFVNGRRYDGPWDESSFTDAMLRTPGHRLRSAAEDFAGWAPAAGVLLLLAAVLAVLLVNSAAESMFTQFWQSPLGVSFGDAAFSMSLLHWVNDGLLTFFFLVVGLEIKREFTIGHLADLRAAALPVAAALGGMVVPALVYALIVSNELWSHGWGVPMATDTAFAVALIVMMGDRVPTSLRVFLTAAAIVDDIGSIVVVALFYSDTLHMEYLGAAVLLVGALALLNRAHIYRVAPYAAVGILLWACVHASGLHATLAGVLLALFIPTRPPVNMVALTAQADAILNAEARRSEEVLQSGPSLPALKAFDALHDRLESPAARVLRILGSRSSYVVLPLFALANAGVAIAPGIMDGHGSLALAIIAGLVVGKPLGLFAASWVAVRLGLAKKPSDYSWRQLAGAGALAGIGFTMSLFIAGQAFPAAADFDAAKAAIFIGSIISSLVGVAILWSADQGERSE